MRQIGKYKPNAFNTKNILNLQKLKDKAIDYEIMYLEKQISWNKLNFFITFLM